MAGFGRSGNKALAILVVARCFRVMDKTGASLKCNEQSNMVKIPNNHKFAKTTVFLNNEAVRTIWLKSMSIVPLLAK